MASEDTKVYPGTLCQPGISTTLVTRDISGRIVNSGSTLTAFICPVVHDSFDEPSSIEFASIAVIGTTVNCTIRSRNEIGGSSVSLGPSSITPFPNNIRRLNFATGDANFGNTTNGAVWFVCDLPASSGIISYRVDENEDEG
jgi:hypothetical protein